jgi:hypothetical protein
MNQFLRCFSNKRSLLHKILFTFNRRFFGFFIILLISSNAYANKNLSDEQIIYLILQNTQEYAIHNMMGHEGNQVYVHPIKGYEVVKDKDGNILKDHFNAGSYNYASPTKEPLKHYELDIAPWIKLGNYPKDPTTKQYRYNTYVFDLMDGIIKTLDQQINSKLKTAPDKLCCNKALHEFKNHLKSTKPNSIFYYFQKNKKIDKKDMLLTIKSLQESFAKKYSKNP